MLPKIDRVEIAQKSSQASQASRCREANRGVVVVSADAIINRTRGHMPNANTRKLNDTPARHSLLGVTARGRPRGTEAGDQLAGLGEGPIPSGTYLMEEFFYAGGLPVVIKLWSRNDRNPGGEAISTPTAIATPVMAERNLGI